MMKRFPLGLVISGALTVSLFLALFFDPVLYEWSKNYHQYLLPYLYFCFSPLLAMFALLAVVASKAPERGPSRLVRVLMPLPIIAGMLLAIRLSWLPECDEMGISGFYWDNYIRCEVGGITVICMYPLILMGTVVFLILAWSHFKRTRGPVKTPHPDCGQD